MESTHPRNKQRLSEVLVFGGLFWLHWPFWPLLALDEFFKQRPAFGDKN
jgi:hypothetical protein